MSKKQRPVFTPPHDTGHLATVSIYDGRVDLSVDEAGQMLDPDVADALAENLHAAAEWARAHPKAARRPQTSTTSRAGIGLGQGATVDTLLTQPTAIQARIADMMKETSVVEQVLRARGTDDDGQPVRYLQVTTMDPT